MKYTRFTINSYRGIVNPLIINVKENSPVALVGLNESGKSTIIDAIFAFDADNDALNENYLQLQNCKNLYARPTERTNADIVATIQMEDTDFESLLTIFKSYKCINNKPKDEVVIEGATITSGNTSSSTSEIYSDEEILTAIKAHLSTIKIQRIIKSKSETEYHLLSAFEDDILNFESIIKNESLICKKIIEFMPTMIYVKEFDSFKEEIAIHPTQSQLALEKEYRNLYNNLFLAATNGHLSLNAFFEITDPRDRIPYLEDVNKYLNEVFTSRWKKFSMEHNFSDLSLQLTTEQNGTMKISVSEVVNGTQYAFNISDRSSGFQWYFNFIFRTLFNSNHKNGKNNKVLYLMDEPGTFLHESSQKSLSIELRDIIKDNYLIYTTHHFQMINLKNISLNNIYIIEKRDKLITAYKTTDYQGYDDASKTSSFLPILHTLRVSLIDFLRDETLSNKKFLIVEGLHDYYFISMFVKCEKSLKDVIVYPSVGASQIVSNLPEFMYYSNNVYALFDNDKPGCEAKDNFVKSTSDLYLNHVFVLPFDGYDKDKQLCFTMNHMFTQDLLESIYKQLISKGIFVYDSGYKNIMDALFNNQNVLPKLKLNDEFKAKLEKLTAFLVDKLKN